MVEKAQMSKAVSSRLLTRAKTPHIGGEHLRSNLQLQKEQVSTLEETVREAEVHDSTMSRQLERLDSLQGKHIVSNFLNETQDLSMKSGRKPMATQSAFEGTDMTCLSPFKPNIARPPHQKGIENNNASEGSLIL